MYEVQIDLFEITDGEENPSFSFDTKEEAYQFIDIILDNGYRAKIHFINED